MTRQPSTSTPFPYTTLFRSARLAELGLDRLAGVTLAPPQPYARFLSLEGGAAAVVTDSGGVQEETTALGVPCFTLRKNTERDPKSTRLNFSHSQNSYAGFCF